ncbi:hypothetical protein ACNOYE_02435 [Nannocystaceae bacterium ST9]
MIIDEVEYSYAFDPNHPQRGDQPIERLRWLGLDVTWERGDADQWTVERQRSFTDTDERDLAIALQQRRWTARGLESSDRELDIAIRCSARSYQLEQEIRTCDPPEAALTVHADWLQRQGDPRGLLAALDLARARASDPDERERANRAFHAALVEHQRHLFGPYAESMSILRLGWSGGQVFGLDLKLGNFPDSHSDRLTRKWIRGLLELPVFACLRSLKISQVTHTGTFDAILSADPELLAGLRELEGFDGLALAEGPSLPGIERLSIEVGVGPPLRLPRLRELELTSAWLDHLGRMLGASEFPNLRELTLHSDLNAARGGPASALANLLALPVVASLERLVIENIYPHPGTCWPVELARVLVGAPALRGALRVELRAADFQADAIALLAECCTRRPHWRLDPTPRRV